MSDKLHEMLILSGVKKEHETTDKEVVEEAEAEDATFDAGVGNVDNQEDKEERMGIDNAKVVEVPKDVTDASKTRIKELKDDIEDYNSKGWGDYTFEKERAIEVIEKLLSHFNDGDLESFKQAQILFTTLPSTIRILLPAKLVLFTATSDKDREDVDSWNKEVKTED